MKDISGSVGLSPGSTRRDSLRCGNDCLFPNFIRVSSERAVWVPAMLLKISSSTQHRPSIADVSYEATLLGSPSCSSHVSFVKDRTLLDKNPADLLMIASGETAVVSTA